MKTKGATSARARETYHAVHNLRAIGCTRREIASILCITDGQVAYCLRSSCKAASK